MAHQRPNILWYCTDQQRFDTIGALGNPHIRTPNLDRFVAAGTAFTHAYCQSPICTPSRASFLTGMYPSRVHNPRNGNGWAHREVAANLVTRQLAEAGYDGGLVGKLHLAGAFNGREPRVNDGYRYFKYSHARVTTGRSISTTMRPGSRARASIPAPSCCTTLTGVT